MCVAFFTFGGQGRPLLLLAFNRDEYLNRPTQPLHFWPDYPVILAGRDLEAQGTWLGCSTLGRVAFLTNLREADPVEPSSSAPAHRSRGELPVQFLSGAATPHEYAQGLHGQDYHGFNLVLGDLNTMEFVYAHNATGTAVIKVLDPGTTYGLSNGKLMEWPKVASGVEVLDSLLTSMNVEERKVPRDKVMGDLLGNNHREVPAPPEGSSFLDCLEHITSSRFVDLVDTPYGPYGTRSQTVVTVWEDGSAEVLDRHLGADRQWKEEYFALELALHAAGVPATAKAGA